MFHHIVMLNLKAPLKDEDRHYILSACEEISRELPGIVSLDFVENLSDRSQGYSHAFTATFVDADAHDNYQLAPVHVPLKDKVKEIAAQLVVLDYER